MPHGYLLVFAFPWQYFSTRQRNKLQTPTMARFEAHGLGTTSPCSPSPVAGWSGRYSQRQSNRQGGYSENAVIRSQVQCGVRPGHVHRAGTLRRVWWVGSHPSRHRSNAPGASMALRVSACRTSVTGWGGLLCWTKVCPAGCLRPCASYQP